MRALLLVVTQEFVLQDRSVPCSVDGQAVPASWEKSAASVSTAHIHVVVLTVIVYSHL
jgi:hypothetical protein